MDKRYDYVGDFYEDIAIAKLDGKQFHINDEWKPLYDERYDWVWDYKDGIAEVLLDGERFKINKKWERV